MRDELERVSKRPAGPIEVPSMLADWVRDLVRRYQAEKDPAKRAVLVADAWPKAFAACPEPFARAFADAAALEPRPKVDHLKRALPEAFLACNCEGIDPDAIEVLMAISARDILTGVRAEQRQQATEAARAAGVKALGDVIRKGGALHRVVGKGTELRCERFPFRPGRKPGKGRQGAFDYEYADGTLTLSGPNAPGIGMGCFFKLRVASSRPDALLLAGDKVSEAVYLTPAACEAALARHPEPVTHLCPW